MKEPRFRIHETSCDTVSCPKCSSDIHFTTLHLPFIPQPFMYCQECSNVLYRSSDMDDLDKALTGVDNITEGTLEFYEALEQSAPPCPCGGRFSLWSNVKCPTCGCEIPYNEGVRDPEARVNDHIIIVIDGAIVVKDEPERSWQCRCSK